MRTEHLQFNNLSPEAFEWVQATYTAIDSMNVNDFGRMLAEEAELMFANNPIAHGKTQLLGGIQAFWRTINGLNHHFIKVYQIDYTLILEAMIDYTRKDNQIVTIPCTTIIERNAKHLATHMRIYLDVLPIYQ
ncbi:MAG: nuclear transport factor 2 family protein [Saprospiraceae bacterium]